MQWWPRLHLSQSLVPLGVDNIIPLWKQLLISNKRYSERNLHPLWIHVFLVYTMWKNDDLLPPSNFSPWKWKYHSSTLNKEKILHCLFYIINIFYLYSYILSMVLSPDFVQFILEYWDNTKYSRRKYYWCVQNARNNYYAIKVVALNFLFGFCTLHWFIPSFHDCSS